MARNRKRARDRRPRQQPDASGMASNGDLNGDEAPNPIEHATPDSELAEAQLALGRPELADAGDAEEAEEEYEESSASAEVAIPAGRAAAEPRPRAGNRLINFLQGSWRELQRVQWPDRRQVMQATGVVLGFVIVAGVFLGVADYLAGKIVNYVLTGHFK